MRKLDSKDKVFSYIKKKYCKNDVKGIAIVGSIAKGKIKNFSDFDVVVFNTKMLKPEYELILVKNKTCLITVYFYKAGKKQDLPKNGVVIFGDYFEQIEHKNNLRYNKDERMKRDNQMFIDGLFKFLRSKEKHYLNWIDKYSNI